MNQVSLNIQIRKLPKSDDPTSLAPPNAFHLDIDGVGRPVWGVLEFKLEQFQHLTEDPWVEVPIVDMNDKNPQT